jgi:hypothetical protein
MHATPRFARRWSAVLLTALLVLAVGCDDDGIMSHGGHPRETYEDSTVLSVDFVEIRRVAASTRNGVITVEAKGLQVARLTIRKIVRATTQETAERIAEGIQVDTEVLADEFEIRSNYPDPPPGIEVRVDYRLECPAEVALDLLAINGELIVSGTSHAVVAAVSNGRIEIAPAPGSTGALRADAVNGAVTVDLPLDVSYALSAVTLNGCISGRFESSEIDHCRAGVQRVRLGDADGVSCDLRVVNGTIEFGSRAP